MIDRSRLAYVLFLAVLLAAGCSSTPEPAGDAATPAPAPSPADDAAARVAPDPAEPPEAEDDPPKPSAPAADEPPPSEPSPVPSPQQDAPAAEPSIPEPSETKPPVAEPETPTPVEAEPVGSDSPGVVDPGGTIEMAAAKPGLTKIGAAKCKICHKVQYASWAESAHAKRTPPLECESCHGLGSEYKGLSVMKDPEKS
ncbi:MAG: hypothetical protein OEV00_06030, partial [Acidobacteriota bacterium]|nr:hypothetical protein [Acidobacteriota bacterium]